MEINIDRIRSEMTRLGLNTKELSVRLEMTPQSLYRLYEDKTTTFKTLNRLADVLECDAKDLLR